MKKSRPALAVLALMLLLVPASFAQEKVDVAMVNRIWEESVNRSKVMETLSYLTDVIGPRIPGSPAMKKACEWTKNKLTEWGLANAAIEPCGEFGLGWANDYISVHMTE